MNDIQKYLNIVCEQIRFQKAHDTIKKELQNHISDQTTAFMEEGLEKQQAIQKAIDEMGDPVAVGTALDSVHRPKMQWKFLVFVIMIFAAGEFFLYFLDVYTPAENRQFFHISYIIRLFINMMIMMLFYFVDFTIFARHIKKIYAFYILIIMTFFLCSHQYGRFYFIDFSIGLTVLPPLIYIFPVILVGLLYHCRGKSYKSILICGSCFILPVLFTLRSHFRMAIIPVSFVVLLMITIAICKNWFTVKKSYALFLLYACSIIACIAVFLLFPDLKERLSQILEYSRFQKPLLKNIVQSASLFGKKQNLQFIYNMLLTPNFNYAFCYMLYSAGWIFCIPLIAVYAAFIIYGFSLLKKQKGQFGTMMAKTILFMYLCSIIWNIACNCGLFFSTNPLPLPFFANNSAIYYILLGILLSVFRTEKYEKESIHIHSNKNEPFIELKNGTLYIHFKRTKKARG